MQIRILMSGITSFSGAHIARKLVDSGALVFGTLTRPLSEYSTDSVLRARMEFSRVKNWIPEFSNERQTSHDVIRELKAQVWVGHGAPIKGYRSMNFDFMKSVQETLNGTNRSIEVFKENGGVLYVHSGTVYEADEGVGELPGMSGVSEALSPYGLSKNLVWNALRFFCSQLKLPILKVVIPNPIGPFENADRLIPVFAELWKRNEVPEMKTSHLIRDQLPAEWLANVYQTAISDFLSRKDQGFSVKIRRPSGFVMSNKKFMELCQKEFKSRGTGLSFDCRFDSVNSKEPIERYNSEPVPELSDHVAKEKFFDDWTRYLFATK